MESNPITSSRQSEIKVFIYYYSTRLYVRTTNTVSGESGSKYLRRFPTLPFSIGDLISWENSVLDALRPGRMKWGKSGRMETEGLDQIEGLRKFEEGE